MKTTISPVSPESLGVELAALAAAAPASAAWPTANKAIYVPFELDEEVEVLQFWWQNGTTVGTDNVDVGVYDESGTLMGKTGATLSAGAAAAQTVTVANLTLPAGRYYLAISVSGTTATFRAIAAGLTAYNSFLGILQQLTAHPLPATGSWVPVKVTGNDYIPIFGISTRTVM